MAIIIKGGTVVTAADVGIADIRIEGETIAAIGRDLPAAKGDQDAVRPGSWDGPSVEPAEPRAAPTHSMLALDGGV